MSVDTLHSLSLDKYLCCFFFNNFSFKMKQENLGFAMFEIMQINVFL